MFRYLYEWTQDLAFYLVLTTAVLHVLPDSDYRKYIRFFTGIILILLVAAPVMKLFGADSQIGNFYHSREYEARMEEIERAAESLEGFDTDGILEGLEGELGEMRSEEGDTDGDTE